MAVRGKVEVHPKDTWSSLAMKQYGDALLGVRLAEANGVDPSIPPAQVPHLRFPSIEELDPDRAAAGPAPGAAQAFADEEASVVKEARYRLVMAMGGSGAMNQAPSAVSSRRVERREPSREEKIARAQHSRKDMAEAIGERDGQHLMLDIKPTKYRRPGDIEQKPTTKEDLARDLASREGRELILEVKPGQAGEESDEHLGDSLAEKDGRAYILEVKAASPKKKKKKKKTGDGEGAEAEGEEEQQIAFGERFGDELAKLDGKALILDVRGATSRPETEEQKAFKKKLKATQELYDDLVDKDGKELILDLNVQVKDEKKFERLKEKRKLAKKRKRRTGAGSLIPEGWRAEGEVSADEIEDYIDELRQQRVQEVELFGEDTHDQTNPIAKAAKGTHHRSQTVERPRYADGGARAYKRPGTEGYGAYDEMQSAQLARGGAVGPRPTRDGRPKQRPAEPPPQQAPAPEAQVFAPEPEPEPPPPPVMPEPPPPPATPPPVVEAAPMEPEPEPEPEPPPPPKKKKRRLADPDSPEVVMRARDGRPMQRRAARADRPRPYEEAPDPSDWDEPAAPSASDWDDEEDAAHLSQMTGLTGLSATGVPAGPLPAVSADDPFAPEALARLCMLSPGSVMQAARAAPVGAGAVLELVGHLREAKNENDQADLLRRFINEHRENATKTLEILLTS